MLFIKKKKIKILLCENDTTFSKKVTKCALPLRHLNTDKISPDLQPVTGAPTQIDRCSFQNKTACADYLLLVVMLYNRDIEISCNLLSVNTLIDFKKHSYRWGQYDMVADHHSNKIIIYQGKKPEYQYHFRSTDMK